MKVLSIMKARLLKKRREVKQEKMDKKKIRMLVGNANKRMKECLKNGQSQCYINIDYLSQAEQVCQVFVDKGYKAKIIHFPDGMGGSAFSPLSAYSLLISLREEDL